MSDKFEHLVDAIRHRLSDIGGFIAVLILHRIRVSFRKKTEIYFTTEGDTMEKAFDIKDLAVRLEKIGLPLAEDMVQRATAEIFAWAGESCALKGGMFAVAVPLLPLVADQIVKLEDKIDGQSGAQ